MTRATGPGGCGGGPCDRLARAAVAVACLLAITLFAGCARSLEPSIFEQLTTSALQAPRPAPAGQNRTEYPEAGDVEDRSREYLGDERAARPTSGGGGFGARETNGAYDISFDDAELSEVVKVVLRDTLQIGYVLDPTIEGRVTVSTAQGLSREELLTLLESIIEINGAVMVKAGDSYRILPETRTRGGGSAAISYATERSQIGPGYGITALPLRHVSAAEVLRILTSFAGTPGSLKAEVNRNLLLVRGSAPERANLIEVAATFDVDWLKGQSAGLYKLLYAAPEDLITELQSILQNGQSEIGEGMVRFVPIKRLNAVLAITKSRKVLDEVATWVERLDKTDPLAEGFFVYRVEHAKAARLAVILNEIFGGRQSSVAISPASEVAPTESLSIATSPSGTSAVATSGPQIVGIAAPAPFAGGSQGPTDPAAPQIVADMAQNKLLIKATLLQYKKIRGLLRKIDQPAAQVMINATLAEVTLNRSLRFGVQAFLQEQNKTIGGAVGFSNGNSLTIAPGLPGLNFIVGSSLAPKVILDALSNQTSVRLVSSPSLVVVNNETASLQVGDDVPISTRQAVSVTDPAAPIVNNIEFRKTGVILRVTPRINSDGLVTMEVEQEISAVAGATTDGAAGTLTPTISQRRLVSTISVYSGQMVVLGGLVSERTSKFANRVPVLEHIPIVGDAVGKTDDTGNRSELVVFIQPTVIRDAADAPAIAEELRQRIGTLAPDDRRQRRVLDLEKRDRVVH